VTSSRLAQPAMAFLLAAVAIVILLPAGGTLYLTDLHRLGDTMLGATVALLVAAIATQSYRLIPALKENAAG